MLILQIFIVFFVSYLAAHGCLRLIERARIATTPQLTVFAIPLEEKKVVIKTILAIPKERLQTPEAKALVALNTQLMNTVKSAVPSIEDHGEH